MMIAGVTIGIGILGLPVQTGLAGIIPSILIMIIVWLFMLSTGWIIARHVTQSDNPREDLGSLFSKTLGLPGKVLTMIGYFLLLYGILVAHLAAGGQILASLNIFSFPLSVWALVFFIIATFIALVGAKQIDRASTILLLLLILVFFVLIYFTMSHVVPERYNHQDWSFSISAVPIIICALTYHIIIPSVCRVLDNDFKAVKKALLIGTVLPILINILWIVAVLGALPLLGEKCSIASAFDKNQPAVIPLAQAYPGTPIRAISLVFSMVALLLSYVLQAASMVSFFSDLLAKKFPARVKLYSNLLTFLPSLAIVLAFPNLFLSALNITGGISIILLCGILPAMVGVKWARKKSKLTRMFMIFLLTVFTLFFCIEVAQETGFLKLRPDMEYEPAPSVVGP